MWCKRFLNWWDHLERASQREHLASLLLTYHNDQWLRLQRSKHVPSSFFTFGSASSQGELYAGVTGTRLNIGRPQQRWLKGRQLAQAFNTGRRTSFVSSGALLSTSTMLQEAARAIQV